MVKTSIPGRDTNPLGQREIVTHIHVIFAARFLLLFPIRKFEKAVKCDLLSIKGSAGFDGPFPGKPVLRKHLDPKQAVRYEILRRKR
jgi:hypothetical protein